MISNTLPSFCSYEANQVENGIWRERDGMPYPKFSDAFLISFGGDIKNTEILSLSDSGPCRVSSYRAPFYQNNHHPRSIAFATQRPRKLLPYRDIKLCAIDYPWDRSFMFLRNGEQISGIGLAEEQIASLLEHVIPYSVIYLDLHGNPSENYFAQHYMPPKGESSISLVEVSHMAKLLFDGIPKLAQIGLKIHLLTCNGDRQAQVMMGYLNQWGFQKTCVVGYKHPICVLAQQGPEIMDFYAVSNESDSDESSDQRIYKKDNPDEKLVAHNYSGVVDISSYKIFKPRLVDNLSSLKRFIYELIYTVGYACFNEQLLTMLGDTLDKVYRVPKCYEDSKMDLALSEFISVLQNIALAAQANIRPSKYEYYCCLLEKINSTLNSYCKKYEETVKYLYPNSPLYRFLQHVNSRDVGFFCFSCCGDSGWEQIRERLMTFTF